MTRYESAEQAETDGIRIVFEPEASRFSVFRGEGDDLRRLGEAHYTLVGEAGSAGATIDFDHTIVGPELRGTGVAGFLAERAFSSDIIEGRAIRTSCSFMHGYRAKHLLA